MRRHAFLVGLALAALTVACGDLSHDNPVDPDFRGELHIDGENEVRRLRKAQYGVMHDGRLDTRIPFAWSSSDVYIASISQDGELYGYNPGVVTITAEYLHLRVSREVTVLP